MDVHSPSPKPQGARHQHSRSATNATPVKANGNEQVTGNPSSTRRRRNNKNRGNKPPPQQTPAWDNAIVTDPNDGHFDANGNFVSGQPQDSSSPEDSPGPNKSKGKTPRPPKNQSQNRPNGSGNSSQPNADVERMNQVLRRNSPPNVAVTPAKQAYAGPTFHASPAASALPMPSFFSKSLPNVAINQPGLQARLDQESSASDKSNDGSPPTSTSNPLTSAPPPPREESPLDFFFKADREEKAKRAAGSHSPGTPNGKLVVPTLQSFQSAPPHANNWAEIYGTGYRHHSRTASHDSQRGVFALELDGTSVQPKQAPTSPQHEITSSSARPGDKRQPLRNFLNSTANGSSSPQPLPSPDHHLSGYSSDHQNSSPFYRPQPQVRSSSGPSTPSPYQQQNTSLHYGNRNLSPLFKAAGNNHINRSTSSLRREVTSSPTTNSVELPAFNTPPTSQPPSAVRSRSHGHGHGTHDTTPTPDVKSMEDDLRRMLKITAFGGGATPGMASG